MPGDFLSSIIDQYNKNFSIKRPYFGFSIKDSQTKNVQLCLYKGVFVNRVNSDSLADKAGIKLGEIIEKIYGNQIKNFMDFFKCMDYK